MMDEPISHPTCYLKSYLKTSITAFNKVLLLFAEEALCCPYSAACYLLSCYNAGGVITGTAVRDQETPR